MSKREFFIDNLLVRIHFIIEMIWWTGLAPWEFGFPFPGSLISTFLGRIKRFWHSFWQDLCGPASKGTEAAFDHRTFARGARWTHARLTETADFRQPSRLTETNDFHD